jgi:hypothetical protein
MGADPAVRQRLADLAGRMVQSLPKAAAEKKRLWLATPLSKPLATLQKQFKGRLLITHNRYKFLRFRFIANLENADCIAKSFGECGLVQTA